eukprot:3322092-Rhodomonas_salina.1
MSLETGGSRHAPQSYSDGREDAPVGHVVFDRAQPAPVPIHSSQSGSFHPIRSFSTVRATRMLPCPLSAACYQPVSMTPIT